MLDLMHYPANLILALPAAWVFGMGLGLFCAFLTGPDEEPCDAR